MGLHKSEKQLKYLADPDPWLLTEYIPDIDFHFSQIWLSSFVKELARTIGRRYTKVLSVYRGYSLRFYYGERESQRMSQSSLKLIVTKPSFGLRINGQIRRTSAQLKQLSGTITAARLGAMTNSQLRALCQQLDRLHTTVYTWGWIPNAVDMFHGDFTSHLKSILAKKVSADSINTALVQLSVSPEKSVIQQERESFLKLVQLRQQRVPKNRLDAAVRRHYHRFFYLKHLWIGKHGVYTTAYYQNEIARFITSGKKATEQLRQGQSAFRHAVALRRRVVAKLKLTKKELQLFDIYADFAVTKLIRRDAQIFWAYMVGNLFTELSRRFGVSVMAVRFMLPTEISQALQAGKLSSAFKKELTARTRLCVYYAEPGQERVFIGAAAERLVRSIQKTVQQPVDILTGQTACLGTATGIARIINSPADMAKMRRGDILVSVATNPDIVTAMRKAAAIVTEQGGITSHAAIVARELGIPCVIGTKIATQVIVDGDTILVDANRGEIRVIKRPLKPKR